MKALMWDFDWRCRADNDMESRDFDEVSVFFFLGLFVGWWLNQEELGAVRREFYG